jgi:hypothetical protein
MVHFGPAKAEAYGGDATAGERTSRELNDRFAGWYYVICGKDFQNLRLGRGPKCAAGAAALRKKPRRLSILTCRQSFAAFSRYSRP